MGTISDMGGAITGTTISKGRMGHIVNRHIPSVYAKQLPHKSKDAVLKQLDEGKTFFNKNWDKSLVEEADVYKRQPLQMEAVCATPMMPTEEKPLR